MSFRFSWRPNHGKGRIRITYAWFDTGEPSGLKNPKGVRLAVVLFGTTVVELNRGY